VRDTRGASLTITIYVASPKSASGLLRKFCGAAMRRCWKGDRCPLSYASRALCRSGTKHMNCSMLNGDLGNGADKDITACNKLRRSHT